MYVRLTALAAALISCTSSAWAALPTHETYSAAADFGTNVFDSSYTQLLDVTSTPGTTAQISGTGYTASASSTLGSNRVYASASATLSNVFGASSFSGWYDQVTITGGSGTGTAYFTVQLNGTVDVGAIAGGLGYTLGTSSVHPSQLTSDLLYFNTLPSAQPWPMDAVNPIASYLLGASPYNDTSILFPEQTSTSPSSGTSGIPALDDPYLIEGDMGFPTPDLILTPGPGHNVDVTLHGTLNFTYGEAFYLIGGLGVNVFGDGLETFCTFSVDGSCSPPRPKTAPAPPPSTSPTARISSTSRCPKARTRALPPVPLTTSLPFPNPASG